MDQIDSAPPIAGLCEMVALARQRAAEDPFGNPTLSVALTLSRWMDRGELDLDGIAALVQLLRDRAFERRAGRLAAYAGGADPAANAAALDRLAASLARPDADDSPVPFAAYRGLCERTRFAAVFTAHPTFALPAADGSTVALADYLGRSVIVYFYPNAGTPGCTKQACDFRDNLTELGDSGYRVLGVSPDKQEKLAKFVANEQLTFPLLSDPEKKVLTEWGAFGEKKNYGRTYMGIIRSAFLIDEKGKIAQAWYKISPKDTPLKLQQALADS